MDNPKTSLLPDRHPTRDFFIADIFDNLPFKDDIASMEHPFFSLSKKKDMREVEYINGNVSLSIIPSIRGLPTIFDKDVLLYCASVMMAEINKGVIPPRKLRISSRDLLVATNRTTDGRSYDRLKNALDRLKGVSIKTNIKTNRHFVTSSFGIIDNYEIVESSKVKNRMVRLEITLSEWFYNSIIGKEVLTINRNYFRLGKPIERRLYEIARKHCGSQKLWSISLNNLYKKVGTTAVLRRFKYNLNEMIQSNHIPDYTLSLSNDDLVTFTNRNYQPEQVTLPFTDHKTPDPILKTDTLEKARKIAPGYDKYWLKEEWLEFWRAKGCPPFEKNADAAFLGFCKAKHKENPTP